MALAGRTALITGSTSGIGLGLAMTFARAGANIVLNGYGDVAAAKETVLATGVKVRYHGADMSRVSDIEAMMAYAAKELGGVDILINNAGIQHVAPVHSFPTAKWDSIIAVNLSSAFHTTRLAIPPMKEKGYGRIINVASVHGLVASAGKSAYVAAKHGVVGLTKAVALETATTPITVNAICPGWVMTPLVQKQIEARALQESITNAAAQTQLLAEKEPSLQFTEIEDIGQLALFFCSPAGANVRGVAWQMDGGWTAQ